MSHDYAPALRWAAGYRTTRHVGWSSVIPVAVFIPTFIDSLERRSQSVLRKSLWEILLNSSELLVFELLGRVQRHTPVLTRCPLV